MYYMYTYIYIMWLVVSTPLKNISSWDDYSHIIMENLKMFQTTNHDIIYIYTSS